MGSDPRCDNHVPRADHADICMGSDPKRMGHLLRLVPLLLRNRRRGRISNDGDKRDGKRRWVRENLHERGPSPSGPQSDERLPDARLGPILQPGPLDSPPTLLSSWEWEPTLLGPGHSMDLSHLLCHSSTWNPLARLLPNIQDEGGR